MRYTKRQVAGEATKRIRSGLYQRELFTRLNGKVVNVTANIERVDKSDGYPESGWVIYIPEVGLGIEDLYCSKKEAMETLLDMEARGFARDSFLGTFVCKAEKKEKRVERRFHAWVQADRMYRRRFHGKHASSNAKKWMRNKTAQLQRDGKHPNDAKVCWDRYEDGVFICTEVYTRLGADFDWAE